MYFGLLLDKSIVGVAESENRVAAIFLLSVWALEPPKRSFLPYSGSYGCLMAERQLEMLRNPRLRPRRVCVCVASVSNHCPHLYMLGLRTVVLFLNFYMQFGWASLFYQSYSNISNSDAYNTTPYEIQFSDWRRICIYPCLPVSR